MLTDQCSYFIPPENYRKPMTFRCLGNLKRENLSKMISDDVQEFTINDPLTR